MRRVPSTGHPGRTQPDIRRTCRPRWWRSRSGRGQHDPPEAPRTSRQDLAHEPPPHRRGCGGRAGRRGAGGEPSASPARNRRTDRGAGGTVARRGVRCDGPFGARVAAGPDLWLPRAARAGITADGLPRGLSVRAARQRRGQRPCAAPSSGCSPAPTGWAMGPTTRCSRSPAWSSWEPPVPCSTASRRTGTPSPARPPTSPSSTSPSRTSAPALENRDEGVVNHDQGNGWTIRHNTVRWNGGAGVFIGDGNIVAHNCLQPTASTASAPTKPTGSATSASTTTRSPATTRPTGRRRVDGCGCTGGGKFWDDHERRHHQQLGPRQPGGRHLGGHEQLRLPRLAQLHRRQRRRGNDLRDQLQRGDLAQHVPAQRARRRSEAARLPDAGALHLRDPAATPGRARSTARPSGSWATASWTTGPASSPGRTPTASPVRRRTPARARRPW